MQRRRGYRQQKEDRSPARQPGRGLPTGFQTRVWEGFCPGHIEAYGRVISPLYFLSKCLGEAFMGKVTNNMFKYIIKISTEEKKNLLKIRNMKEFHKL